jgi:hypothetical protein
MLARNRWAFVECKIIVSLTDRARGSYGGKEKDPYGPCGTISHVCQRFLWAVVEHKEKAAVAFCAAPAAVVSSKVV